MKKFSACSTVAVTPEQFWNRMSLTLVKQELAPLLRMTAPDRLKNLTVDKWPTGQRLFSSVILLFGVIPVDVHRFKLQWTKPGSGFQESSSSWLNRYWHHKRTTQEVPGGCVIQDSVSLKSRIPLLHWMVLPIYRAVFRYRRLRTIFGEVND